MNDHRIGACAAPATQHRLGGEYAQASAPRPTVHLQQAVSELNEVASRGRSELKALVMLHEHLRASIYGPQPSPCADKEIEPPHLPLADIPHTLVEQSAMRGKIMEQIAGLLGAT